MVALMAILIAVLIDRGADYIPGGKAILQCRIVSWVNSYSAIIIGWLSKVNITQNYLILLALALPLCIALLFLQYIFVASLGTIGKVLFLSAALLYFLGNTDVDESESMFVRAHETSFAILFWFAILGPVGALLYWFLIICEKNETVKAAATWTHAVAAWIPARITGFLYALVGGFTSGFRAWMSAIVNVRLMSSQVLVDCGQASVDTAEPGDESKLLLRAYIAWAVLSMLIVLLK